jgi:hypothetical protein
MVATSLVFIEPFLALMRLHPTDQNLWVAYFWIPALYYYCLQERNGKNTCLALAGLLMGLSMLAKQAGLLVAVPVLAYALTGISKRNWKQRAASLGITVIFAAIPPLLVAAWYASQGAFGNLWQCLYTANHYNPLDAMGAKVVFLRNRLIARALTLVGVGLILSWFIFKEDGESPERRIGLEALTRRPTLALLSGLIVYVLFIVAGPAPSPYYLLPLLPFAAILAASAAASAAAGIRLSRNGLYAGGPAAGAGMGWGVVVPALMICASIPFYGPEAILVRHGHAADSTLIQEKVIGEFVKEHVSPSECIFVLANPVFYYRSDRLACNKYMGVFKVFERTRLRQEYEDSILGAMEDKRTRLVLVGAKYSASGGWGGALTPRFMTVLRQHYVEAATFDYPYDSGVTAFLRKGFDDSSRASDIQ